jgi:hypothetical protein
MQARPPGPEVPGELAGAWQQGIEDALEGGRTDSGTTVVALGAAPTADQPGGRDGAAAGDGGCGRRQGKLPDRPNTLQTGGGGHLVQYRPAGMGTTADGIGASLPRPHAGGRAPGVEVQRGRRRPLGLHAQQQVRQLPFGADEIRLPIQAQEGRHLGVAGGQQGQIPAQQGGGVAKGPQGVADVELHIAEGPLAILPGLPPGDAGEADEQHRIAPQPQGATLFQQVILGGVMVDPVRQPRDAGGDYIALGGVQVAAGGIAAQRPAAALVLLPGRQPQGALQQDGQALQG